MRSTRLALARCCILAALASTSSFAQGTSTNEAPTAQANDEGDARPLSTGVSTGSRSLDLLLNQRSLPQDRQQPVIESKLPIGAPAAASAPQRSASEALRDALIREAVQSGLIGQEAVEAKLKDEAAERSKRASSSLDKATKIHGDGGGSVSAYGGAASLQQTDDDGAVPNALLKAVQAITRGIREYRYLILGVAVVGLAMLLSLSKGKSRSAHKPMGKSGDTALLRHSRQGARRHR